MRLALNIAKMAKGRFLRGAIEEMHYLIKKPHAEVREEKKWGVEFPVHKKVKSAIDRHPAMLCQNHTPRCLPCQNGTAKICRHAADAKELVYLRPTDADSRLQSQLQSQLQSRCHLYPENHWPQPVTLPVLNISKSSICRPDMFIHIHLCPVLNHLHSINLPMIASTTHISIQICCLMKEHPLVSILSAVW